MLPNWVPEAAREYLRELQRHGHWSILEHHVLRGVQGGYSSKEEANALMRRLVDEGLAVDVYLLHHRNECYDNDGGSLHGEIVGSLPVDYPWECDVCGEEVEDEDDTSIEWAVKLHPVEEEPAPPRAQQEPPSDRVALEQLQHDLADLAGLPESTAPMVALEALRERLAASVPWEPRPGWPSVEQARAWYALGEEWLVCHHAGEVILAWIGETHLGDGCDLVVVIHAGEQVSLLDQASGDAPDWCVPWKDGRPASWAEVDAAVAAKAKP